MKAEQDQPERAAQEAISAALYALVASGVRRRTQGVHLTALTTLASLERTGPRRVTDLAVIQGVAQPSMTTLVKNLEQSGLVERTRDPQDGRVALVSLTPGGSRLLRARREEGAEAFARLVGQLSPREQATLTAALPALEHFLLLEQQERDPVANR